MKSRILSATLAMLVSASPVVAGEEPFGMGFDGWKFTQEDRKEGILCRAILGQNIIARFSDGKMYVSMPAGKVPAGSYPETHLDIGGTSEPVDAKSDGKRFWLNSEAVFSTSLQPPADITGAPARSKGSSSTAGSLSTHPQAKR